MFSFLFQVYDVTNRESFGKIENWLNELETYSTNHDIVKMLVGNKVRGFVKKSKLCAKPKCDTFVLFSTDGHGGEPCGVKGRGHKAGAETPGIINFPITIQRFPSNFGYKIII